MEILISITIWTLALYGLFEIIKNIIYICTYTKINTKGIYLLVAVRNQEENIECFLRNIMFRIIYGKEEIENIMIIDLNSTDKTREIIEKLENEYEKIKLLNWKECRELLENIKEN
jgi:cellulose synthase/poly-beta-1,6-N-acetylglucosamine synthase-like glycosyltransferase